MQTTQTTLRNWTKTNPPTASELVDWAANTARSFFAEVIPKVREYGSVDLEVMGEATVGGMEAATEFYLLGKVARAMSAHQSGHEPSLDTLFDQVVYALMIQFIREFGFWGVAQEPADKEATWPITG